MNMCQTRPSKSVGGANANLVWSIALVWVWSSMPGETEDLDELSRELVRDILELAEDANKVSFDRVSKPT